MNSTRPNSAGQVLPASAALVGALLIVIAVVAVVAWRPAAPFGPLPSSTPMGSPTAVPSTPPSAPASDAPTQARVVRLENATNHDVTVRIQDAAAILIYARSGQPGEGMSVRWHDLLIRNVDPTTIELTYVGLPLDDAGDVAVRPTANGIGLSLVQAGPMPYSDAMGEDRILILSFDRAVDASQVSVTIKDRPTS